MVLETHGEFCMTDLDFQKKRFAPELGKMDQKSVFSLLEERGDGEGGGDGDSPYQSFIPTTTKQQFSSYNPIKTAFSAVVL